MSRRNLLPAFCVLTAACGAGAQSVAASLDAYRASTRIPAVAGTAAQSFSGIAFNPDTRTLFVVDDTDPAIYELNVSGTLLRAIAIDGFQDTEGIAHQSGDAFFIAEEGRADIVRIRLPGAGGGQVSRSTGIALALGPPMGNTGIEGVAYRTFDRTVFAVKESDPSRIYRVSLDSAGNPFASQPDDPFVLGGKSGDAADILALNDGHFLIVNQDQNRLEGFDPQGRLLSHLPLGMAKPEGVALDAEGAIYVVGEPREFAVFWRNGVSIRPARNENPAVGPSGASYTASGRISKGFSAGFNVTTPYSVRIQPRVGGKRGKAGP